MNLFVSKLIPILFVSIFTFLGAVHIYWVWGKRTSWQAVIPGVNGQPAFRPSTPMSYFVAFGLFLCAQLISITAGFVILPLPSVFFKWLTFGLVSRVASTGHG